MPATLLKPNPPPSILAAPMPGGLDNLDALFNGDAQREWEAFLALGRRVDAAILGGHLPWRHPPVLLSF